jgi:hypothetical protein
LLRKVTEPFNSPFEMKAVSDIKSWPQDSQGMYDIEDLRLSVHEPGVSCSQKIRMTGQDAHIAFFEKLSCYAMTKCQFRDHLMEELVTFSMLSLEIRQSCFLFKSW